MTRIWWVRHGPTGVKAMLGWTNMPADLGDTARLARLMAYLPDAPVIASDLQRASATATAICGTRPRLPDDPDLREMNFGQWEMRAFSEIEAEDPVRLRAFYEDPGSVRPPDGECWDDIAARMARAVDRLLSLGVPDVIAVAHMGAILTQVQRALRLTAYDTFAHRIDPLSVTRLRHENGNWATEAINHLP